MFKYLTDSERAGLKPAMIQRTRDAYASLPPVNELIAAALAGAGKRGWYADSRAAIVAQYGGDAPRFAALLAALSPQCSVGTNLYNARNTFGNWIQAGRPQTRVAILRIMADSVQGSNKSASILPAWINNAVRALTCENPEALTLSGPKVNAFMRNLQGDTGAVTLDAWMARFAGLDAKRLGGSGRINQRNALYLAYSAKIRAAAKLLGWAPAEVQESIWSWTKAAYEYGESIRALASIAECVADGAIDAGLIAKIQGFAELLTHRVPLSVQYPYVPPNLKRLARVARRLDAVLNRSKEP